jgi:hypothetical protein
VGPTTQPLSESRSPFRRTVRSFDERQDRVTSRPPPDTESVGVGLSLVTPLLDSITLKLSKTMTTTVEHRLSAFVSAATKMSPFGEIGALQQLDGHLHITQAGENV